MRELGRGGQAVVHLAEDARLGRKVALKVLNEPLGEGSIDALIRFQREAEVASRLDHPGICAVYEAGEFEGRHYIAMRHVEGETLAACIARARSDRDPPPVPTRREEIDAIVELFERAARALHAAHEAGLIHRDVKPGNIMVSASGEPVILDFGLARDEESAGETLTLTGVLMGTPAYMSPEQLIGKGARLDRRTDVYSLGVALYERLTLRRPFVAPTREALYRAIVAQEPRRARRVNAAIGRDLEIVLVTALEKDRDRRYQTAWDMAEDLRRVRTREPIRARPAGPLLRSRRWVERNPGVAASLGTVILALGAGLGVSLVLLARLENALRGARVVGLTSAAGEVVESDPMLALLLSREAARVAGGGIPPAETVGQLQAAIAALRERADLVGHEDVVTMVAFSPRGDLVLTASHDGTARLWDVDGRPRAVLRGHTGPVVWAEFSPAGDRVLTSSLDGSARIWDLDGRETAALRPHVATSPAIKESREAATFLHDGSRVLAAGAAGTAVLWTSEGKEVARTDESAAAVTCVAASPAGDRLLTAHEDGVARLWDLDLRPLAVLRGGWTIVSDAAFSPRGDRIVVAGDDDLARLWDRDGRPLTGLSGHLEWEVNSATISPDGERVLTASSDKTARLWDLDGTCSLVLEGSTGSVQHTAFSPDGTRILTASWDQKCRVYNLLGDQLAVLAGHKGPLMWAAFSPDGERIATASRDHTARVWDVGNRAHALLIGHRGGLQGGVFSPDGNFVATTSRDGTVRLWDLSGGGHRVLVAKECPAVGIAWSPLGNALLVSFQDPPEGVVLIRNPAGEARIEMTLPVSGGERVCFDPKGERLIGIDIESRSAQMYDRAGTQLAVFRGHTGVVRSAVFHPRADRVLTASDDGTVRTWDFSGNDLGVLCRHAAAVRSAAYSSTGDRILTASDDTTARLWDSAGTELCVFRGHEGSVLRASLSPDERSILTCSRDGTARVWDLDGRSLAILRGHSGIVWEALFSPSGDRILTCSSDETARIWIADVEKLLRLADQRAFRDFSAAERTRYEVLLGER